MGVISVKVTISVECKGGYSGRSVWLRKLNCEPNENPFQKPYVDYKNSSSTGKSGVDVFYFIDDGEYILRTKNKRWNVTVKEGVAKYEKTDWY